MQKKEPITVIDEIPAASSTDDPTVKIYERELKTSGTITGIDASTYVGHEFDLQYSYYLDKKGDHLINLLDPLGKDFLAGNGENFPLDVRHDFEAGDTLVIRIENEATDHLYHANTRVSMDYAGGIVALLKEVFA